MGEATTVTELGTLIPADDITTDASVTISTQITIPSNIIFTDDLLDESSTAYIEASLALMAMFETAINQILDNFGLTQISQIVTFSAPTSARKKRSAETIATLAYEFQLQVDSSRSVSLDDSADVLAQKVKNTVATKARKTIQNGSGELVNTDTVPSVSSSARVEHP